MSECMGVALFAFALAVFGAVVVYRDLCRREASISMALSTLDNIDRHMRQVDVSSNARKIMREFTEMLREDLTGGTR